MGSTALTSTAWPALTLVATVSKRFGFGGFLSVSFLLWPFRYFLKVRHFYTLQMLLGRPSPLARQECKMRKNLSKRPSRGFLPAVSWTIPTPDA